MYVHIPATFHITSEDRAIKCGKRCEKSSKLRLKIAQILKAVKIGLDSNSGKLYNAQVVVKLWFWHSCNSPSVRRIILKGGNMMKRQFFRGTLFCALFIIFLTVVVSADNVAYPVEGGNLYFDTTTGAITSCDKSVTKATIPSKINGVNVTTIEGARWVGAIWDGGGRRVKGGAFEDCSQLTSVVIPQSVTTIECWAFSGCNNLTSITIPEGVGIIGDDAFHGCRNLESIILPNSVIYIFGD